MYIATQIEIQNEIKILSPKEILQKFKYLFNHLLDFNKQIVEIQSIDKTEYKIESDINDQFVYIKLLQKNLKHSKLTLEKSNVQIKHLNDKIQDQKKLIEHLQETMDKKNLNYQNDCQNFLRVIENKDKIILDAEDKLMKKGFLLISDDELINLEEKYLKVYALQQKIKYMEDSQELEKKKMRTAMEKNFQDAQNLKISIQIQKAHPNVYREIEQLRIQNLELEKQLRQERNKNKEQYEQYQHQLQVTNNRIVQKEKIINQSLRNYQAFKINNATSNRQNNDSTLTDLKSSLQKSRPTTALSQQKKR